MIDPFTFISALEHVLSASADQDRGLNLFIKALQNTSSIATSVATNDLKHPLLSQLDDALDAALGSSELRESVATVASTGDWYQVYTGDGINAEMADYMLANQVVGPKGAIAAESTRAGIFLLAPNFDYLMHDHAANEIYYVHSGTISIQNGTESIPRHLEPGQYSITPSETPHALQTDDEPVLLLYIWTGDVTAPIWWWLKDEDDHWTKVLAKNP